VAPAEPAAPAGPAGPADVVHEASNINAMIAASATTMTRDFFSIGAFSFC
jgi:hypothetical protein